jgi:hypothetical protein
MDLLTSRKTNILHSKDMNVMNPCKYRHLFLTKYSKEQNICHIGINYLFTSSISKLSHETSKTHSNTPDDCGCCSVLSNIGHGDGSFWALRYDGAT